MHRLNKGHTYSAFALSALLSSQSFAADCANVITNSVTCTVPAGATSVVIEAWGAGGGGAGAAVDDSSMSNGGGGGGGGGSYCKATFAVTEGASLTVNVGSVSWGGTYLNNGQDGQPSSVSGAGIIGMQADGGSAGKLNGIGGIGGSTAACTATGATAYSGGNGSSHRLGGGGGGSATSTNNGFGTLTGLGGSGEGQGGDGGAFTNTIGFPGQIPGGGGGGGYITGARSGGNGASGRVKMTFAYSPVSTAPIPTLSQWGLMLTSVLMTALAFIRLRQRR